MIKKAEAEKEQLDLSIILDLLGLTEVYHQIIIAETESARRRFLKQYSEELVEGMTNVANVSSK